MVGRTFPSNDAAIAGHEREFVISHSLWQQWFGGDLGVIGQTLEVQGRVPLTIVGVMPADFRFPREAQFWKAEVWQRSHGRGDTARWRQAIGRVRPGVSIEAAERELQLIEAQLGREWGRLVLFYDNLVESVEAIPGIERAALSAAPALAGWDAMRLARAGIVPPRPDGSPAWRPIQHRAVTPGYFDALRLRLLRGRPFSDRDSRYESLSARRVHATVLLETALFVAVGVAAGALGAWAGTRLLRAQLFGVHALDAATWIGILVTLGAIGLATAWFPARRASRRDPGSMLRIN